MNKQPSFQNAVKWAYTANWGEKGLSALFMFFLAAVLGPRDFGTASIAVIYIAFLQMFLDQGLALALIQTRNLEPEHLNTVFWFDLSLGVVFASGTFFLRDYWAQLNHAPEAAAVISTLTPCIIIEALAIVPMSLLRRRMDFKSISIRTNASMLAGGLVGTGVALAGYGVWALVAQQLVRDSVAVVLLWKLSAWRPRREFSWKHFRQLVPFSVANFTGQLGTFADGQGSALLLGALFGPVAVGLYRLGERIMNSVVTMAMASIQSVALPEFVRLQDRPEDLRSTVVNCIRLSAAATVPALAGLAAVSRPLMAMIGARWVPAVDVLRILSLLGIVLVFSFFTGPFLQGIGRAREAALLEWVRVLAGLTALGIAGWLVRDSSVDRQVQGIVLSKFVTGALVTTPLFVAVLLKLCKIPVWDLVSACFPSAAASSCVAVSVLLLGALPRLASQPPAILLAVEVALGGSIGLAVLLSLDRQLRPSVGAILRRLQNQASVEA